MPHVTFDDAYPTRRAVEESRAIIKIPKEKEPDKTAIVLRRSRTISYKIPEEKSCRRAKPVDKTCIERKITYKDSKDNIIKIIYEDYCGKVLRTIYPAQPPPSPPRECRPPPPPPPPPPQKCESPPVSEPSNIPSEDVKNCDWTKIVVRNSRGVVWKIVHVDCYGKTMKTEYPEPEPPRRQYTETKRYLIKEIDGNSPPRKRCSETKKVVVDKEVDKSPPRKRHSETKKVTVVDKEIESSPPRKRYSETKKVVIDEEIRAPTPKSSSDTIKAEKQYEIREPTQKSSSETIKVEKKYEIHEPTPKSSSDTIKVKQKYDLRATVESDDDSRRSDSPSISAPAPAPPPPAPSPPAESVTDSTITNRRDSVTNSSGKTSAESTREVIKDENGVVKKVIYTDSRGRRRTVVYDDDD